MSFNKQKHSTLNSQTINAINNIKFYTRLCTAHVRGLHSGTCMQLSFRKNNNTKIYILHFLNKNANDINKNNYLKLYYEDYVKYYFKYYFNIIHS